MILRLLILFSLLILCACSKQDQAHYTPMLWKVTGKQLKTTSYIFGTFHTKDPNFETFPPAVLSKLSQSDRLYTEIIMNNRTQKEISRFTKTSHPQKLEKLLHPKTTKLLLHYLINNKLPYTLKTLKAFKVWAIAIMLENQEKPLKTKSSLFMDERLVTYAKKKHIKCNGLETPKEQLIYFDTLNKSQQEQFLLSVLQEEKKDAYKTALKFWYTQGEAKGFLTLQEKYASNDIRQKKLDAILVKGLLLERNARFVRRIDILLQNNKTLSYFFAIGAGHLSDKKGIVSTLKQLGYQLEKVY